MNKNPLLFFSFFALLALSACKKDSEENYYFTMKIDNVHFAFNDTLRAEKTTGQPALFVEAISTTKGTFRGLFSAYTTGQYINTYDQAAPRVIHQFTVNAVIANTNSGYTILSLMRPNPSVANSISMTISKVTDTYMEGTFSGFLINGTLHNISEGRFKVPFK